MAGNHINKRWFIEPNTGDRIPVMDATAPLLVHPLKDDIFGATPEDPENCIFARCLKRMLGATHVYIFKATAYVQMLDARGSPYIARYILGAKAREYTQNFDDGEQMPPVGINLSPPSYATRLDNKAVYNRQYDAQRRKRAALLAKKLKTKKGKMIKGKSAPATVDREDQRGDPRMVTQFRSGAGRVHFHALQAASIKTRAQES